MNLLTNFNYIFQITDPKPITIIFFISISIIAQILITIIIVKGEKSVKSVLLALASSTTIIVFLILGFILMEGLPAFQENDPIEFLTTTNWQPFYDIESTETITITTIQQPYNHIITTPDLTNYITPNSKLIIPISIHNLGGKIDTYSLSNSSSNQLSCHIQQSTISIKPSSINTVNLSINSTNIGNYSINVEALSHNSSLKKKINISIIVTTLGLDLYPDIYNLEGQGADSGLLSYSLNI
jgi:hypothetical protein